MTDEIARSIAGRSFSSYERNQIEAETLARHLQRREKFFNESLTEQDVSQLLNISVEAVRDLVSSQDLLSINENDEVRFPFWQFDSTGTDCIVDGLPAVLKALKVSGYIKLNWLTRPNPYFEGLTPVQALKLGQKERVLAEAEIIGFRALASDRAQARIN